MADGTLSPGDSASRHFIRCAECHGLVPADRVRYREEQIQIASAAGPGRWQAGGPPIFPRSKHSPRFAPKLHRGAQSAARPRNIDVIERVPVCVDCLHRQRMGLYGVCGVVAACLIVAVALYSSEEGPPGTQQIAQSAPADASKTTPDAKATSTPAPGLAAIATMRPPVKDDDISASPPIWQPIRNAAANLFASLSAIPSSTPAAPAPETIISIPLAPEPEASVVASAPSVSAPVPPPQPTAPAAGPPPPQNASAAPDPAPSIDAPSTAPPPTDAPPTDVAKTVSSEPPIWATDRKPARKVATAAPPPRRDTSAAAVNVAAIRNDGYAALQERRYRDAMTLLQRATMMGDAYAPMYVGQIFEHGFGVPRDVGQASYWYGIAIDRGNGAALTAFNRMRVNPY